jgi:hypothetical protein
MKADTLINSAKKYDGTPYVWGGESLEEGGLDCSGLIYISLKDSGYKTVRKTAQGFSLIGKSVSLDSIKSGDLLFFGKSQTKITHCAIYLGNELMIESIGSSKNTKNNKGRGVVISSLYRRSDLVCARRVCEEETNIYKVGHIYTVAVDNLNVRIRPDVKSKRKNADGLTLDGRKHANSRGQLMHGTKVTCKEIARDENDNTWIKIPSGWVCAIYNSRVYVR